MVTRAADDVNDANCATVANGGCTLRQAVNLRTNTPGAGTNTITFAPATFGTAQTITLTAASGPLTLSHPVTITGPGANLLTVDAGCTNCAPGQTPTGGTKHFLIPGAGNYAISGMTLQHGNGSNAGSGSGGAVDVDTGSTPTRHADEHGVPRERERQQRRRGFREWWRGDHAAGGGEHVYWQHGGEWRWRDQHPRWHGPGDEQYTVREQRQAVPAVGDRRPFRHHA